MTTFRTLKQKFALIWPHLDERARRMMAANEARQLGYGGVSSVSRACGLSRVTITKGMRELGAPGGGSDSPPWRRASRPSAARSGFAPRARRAGRTLDARGPAIPFALDEQKHPFARGRTERPAPSGQP